MLNEVSAAKVCLLNPTKKAAYDANLRAALDAQGDSSDSFGRQMAELLADAEPKRSGATRPTGRRPAPAVLVAVAGVAVLALGAVLWVFLSPRPAKRLVAGGKVWGYSGCGGVRCWQRSAVLTRLND